MTGPTPPVPPSDPDGARPAAPARRRWWREGIAARVLLALAPRLLSGGLWVLHRTTRIELHHADELRRRWAARAPCIMAVWHNRVLMMPVPYAGRGLCIMNSRSRDGEIATRALARWGIRSVRGSASRGGASGFLQLVRAFREGYDLAVVPDGPRGPRYVAKVGVIHLARVTGAPVFPVSYAATRRRQLRSWDRLVIPLPFARVAFVVGPPLHVPPGTTDAEAEALRAELERRLNAATREAEALVGHAFDGDGAPPQ